MKDTEHSGRTHRLEFSRNQFLRLLGSALIGVGTKVVVEKILGNEQSDTYPHEELITHARQRLAGKKLLFGTHPDFDRHNFDVWSQMDVVKTAVGAEDLTGLFITVEQLLRPETQTPFLVRANQVAQRGTYPVIGLGYGEKVAGFHPFDPRARDRRREDAKAVMQVLRAIDSPKTVRICYEMNLSAFVYGRGRELSDRQHESGYKMMFAEYAEAAAQSHHQCSLSFSPFAQNFFMTNPFEGYWPVVDGQLLAGSAGFDVYHVFPGVGKLNHPYYWYPGDYSPESALEASAKNMDQLTAGEVEWVIWEIGSLAKNAPWILHAALVAIVNGCSGIMHFNFDKRTHDVPHEGDWTIDALLAAVYRFLLTELNQ